MPLEPDDRATPDRDQLIRRTGDPTRRNPPRSRVDKEREAEALAHLDDGQPELALKILMVTYGELVSSVIRRLMYDRESAKDVYQDVFLKAFRKLETFKRKSSLLTWLYRITHNCCYDHFRKEGHSGEVITAVDFDVLAQLIASPDSMMNTERMALQQMLERGISGMTWQTRFRLLLRYQAGLSHAEIGEVVDAKPEAVQVSISRAVIQLRRYLFREEGSDGQA